MKASTVYAVAIIATLAACKPSQPESPKTQPRDPPKPRTSLLEDFKPTPLVFARWMARGAPSNWTASS